MATGRSNTGKITKAIKVILTVVAVIAVLYFIFIMLLFRDGNKGKHRFFSKSDYKTVSSVFGIENGTFSIKEIVYCPDVEESSWEFYKEGDNELYTVRLMMDDLSQIEKNYSLEKTSQGYYDQNLCTNNTNQDIMFQMSTMFKDCTQLREINLSSFRTDSLTLTAEMFEGCNALVSLDLSGFDMSSISEGIQYGDYKTGLTPEDSEIVLMYYAKLITELPTDKFPVKATSAPAVPSTASVTTTAASSEASLLGDANDDGKVNVADAVAVLQYIANKEKYPLTASGIAGADCDGVKGITGGDAIYIQKLDAGII